MNQRQVNDLLKYWCYLSFAVNKGETIRESLQEMSSQYKLSKIKNKQVNRFIEKYHKKGYFCYDPDEKATATQPMFNSEKIYKKLKIY